MPRKANVPYTLYRRLRVAPAGKRHVWERIGEHSMSLTRARLHYQTRLIANAMMVLDAEYEYRLRAIPPKDRLSRYLPS